jgi:GTP-binding protein
LNGRGVHRLLPALAEAITQYQTRVPTRKVNDLIRRAQQAQPAPHGARILYATQGATDPPTFTLFTSKEVPASYLRYIERQIQQEFGLGSTPIKLRVRRRGD